MIQHLNDPEIYWKMLAIKIVYVLLIVKVFSDTCFDFKGTSNNNNTPVQKTAPSTEEINLIIIISQNKYKSVFFHFYLLIF